MSVNVAQGPLRGGSKIAVLLLAAACGSSGNGSNLKNVNGDDMSRGHAGKGGTGGARSGAGGSMGGSGGRATSGGSGGTTSGTAGSGTGADGGTDSGAGTGGSGGSTMNVPTPPTAGMFTDDFTWSGTHAAVINGGQGTAVWLNANNWDVTGDTHAITVMGEYSNTPTKNASGLTTDTNSGHYVYVQKAADGCDAAGTAPCSGGTDDTVLTPGGDGSPGVAVIGVDEQDIVGARLRSPIAISESDPGIIRLRAPRFVGLGHWWELALTPADRVIGAENTVVESQGEQDGLGDVGTDANQPGKGAGPGHDPQEESFNVVFTGVTDFACETEAALEGSLTRIAIKSLVKNGQGYKTATGSRFNAWNTKDLFNGIFHGTYSQDFIRPGLDGTQEVPASMMNKDGTENTAKVAAANVADMDTLYLWQIEFRPSGVDVKADLNDGKGLTLIEHLNLGVPWPTVYAHFMAVAYQNDHHPQVQKGCAYLPNPYTQRQLKFRSLSIGPVLYANTSVFPPDGAPTDANGNVLLCNNGGSCGAWMKYDMRDTHNFGAPDMVDGVSLKKANAKVFSFDNDYVHGSSKHFSGVAPEQSFDLYVPLSDDLMNAQATNLVYNALGAKGVANLIVNGHMVGPLPTADTVIGASVKNDVSVDEGCPDYDCMSVRRSVAIDPELLRTDTADGLAHLQIVFDQSHLGSGTFLDRIQLEMMH
jgi:hypothetical protein